MAETTVRRQYNQLAAVYDLRWRNYIVNTLSFLKTWVEISPTDTVLDIACGTGEFERLLLTEYSSQQIVGFWYCVGIDGSYSKTQNLNQFSITKLYHKI
jgi:ubiquinone/menaquinone biosynthesis C-methylase UbiE